MTISKIMVSILLVLFGVQATVFAKENGNTARYDLLDKMVEFGKAGGDGQQAEIWFKSLSKEDFFRGLRQVNDKLVEHKQNAKEINGEDLIGYEYMAAGFAQYYFRLYPDSSPEPFLKMAEDHSIDEDYRKFILDIMGDNDFYSLNVEHFDIFCSTLLAIISDPNNTFFLRVEAYDCLKRSTGRLFTEKKNSDDRLKNMGRLDEILKISKDQFPYELWEFFQKMSNVYKALGEILLKTGDEGLTFQERTRLIRMLKGTNSSIYTPEPNLVERLQNRIAILEEINSNLPIRTVQEFLKSLKNTPDYLHMIELLSDKLNYNGVIYSKQEIERTTFLLQPIGRFSYPRAKITVENLQQFSRREYSRFFERSRFSKQYQVNSNDIYWMIHFEIHTYFNDFDKGFVDGVFIGLDRQDKIVAWFD
ncbi:MAG: hypothetical protein ABIG61_04890 [Planctomycetota bacterium]